jgi:hypothetical protein
MAEIRVNSTGGVKLFDADDSHYAQIKAGTISSNTDVLELGSSAVVAGTKVDLNGQELILDADADTSITADTDDQIDFRIAGADDLRMTANAINVLSGTTLTIDSGATITNSGTANGFGALAGIDDQSSSNDDQLTITDTAVVINEDSDDLDFRVESNGNANMLFVSGGNDVVGIGAEGDLGVGLHIKSADSGASVDGNADELVVEGSGQSGITICSANDNKGNIFFADDGSTAQGKVIYDHSDNHLRFDTAGSERMRIKSDGNVGIGETNPSLAKLQINQATSGTLNQICLRQDNNGGGDKQVIRFVRDTDESGSGAEVAAIIAEREGGNDTALIFKTDTAGGGNSTEHFRINAGGDLTATDTSIGSNSDQRLKENIADYNYDIDTFKTYKVKSFDWKNPARHRNKTGQIGFVAQDVESIDSRWLGNVILGDENDPDYSLISADGDGNRIAKTLKLGENDAMYISIIQQSITKIETLETEMTALKARVTTLEG